MFNIAPTYKITQEANTVHLEATDHIIGVEVGATEEHAVMLKFLIYRAPEVAIHKDVETYS